MTNLWRFIPRFDREYSLSDFARAFETLVRGSPADLHALRKGFSPAKVDFARSGRECLYIILKSLRLAPGSHVGVPLYCCMAVFEAIAAAGHTPVFLDVDPHTYGLDGESLRGNKDRLAALVVAHTFGYPADLDGIRACLEGRRIPIVEDCAHSLLSEYKGRLTGTLTEAAFFSFGVHKPVATGGGGMIVVNQSELAEETGKELAALPAESVLAELRHALGAWLRSVAYRRFLYAILMASPLARWRDADRRDAGSEAAEAIEASWKPAKIRRVNQVLLGNRWRDFEARLGRLAENSRRLRKLLQDAPLEVPDDPAWGKWNHFMLPVRYPNARQREAARNFLRDRGVDTCALYQNCERNARLFGYRSGCPQAEQAARTVFTVPNYAWLTGREIEYIGQCLCKTGVGRPRVL